MAKRHPTTFMSVAIIIWNPTIHSALLSVHVCLIMPLAFGLSDARATSAAAPPTLLVRKILVFAPAAPFLPFPHRRPSRCCSLQPTTCRRPPLGVTAPPPSRDRASNRLDAAQRRRVLWLVRPHGRTSLAPGVCQLYHGIPTKELRVLVT